MRAILHPEAAEEFQQAFEVYRLESPKAALRFHDAVFSTVARIRAFPQAWPRLRGSVRKCLVPDFPYQVLYRIEPDRLHILAIMHCKRAPGYWLNR